MLQHGKRLAFLIAGHVFVALAIIGIFLPILPTTPFAILAAWCYGKGSDRLHAWLLGTRTLGPVIRQWEEHGIIRRRAKVVATLTIVATFTVSLLVAHVGWGLKGLLVAIAAGILTFIWTRPERPSR